MRVDIWSDIVCPWCYIGKRQFEQGLAEFGQRELGQRHFGQRQFGPGDGVEVVYHAFELDPAAPAGPGQPVLDMLSARYGLSQAQAAEAEAGVAARAAGVGLAFTADRVTGNTFDAHRLVRLGREAGVQGAVLQRLYEAYFAEGRPVFDRASLAVLAGEAGLDAAQAGAALAEGRYGDEVRADEEQARSLGITGVPFAVLDGRYAVSGAQPPAAFAAALTRASAPPE